MKRIMHFLTKLYPKSWRDRYQVEFGALLEDVNPTGRTLFDILKEALAMQVRTQQFGKTMAITASIGLLLGLFTWLVSPNKYASRALIKIEASEGDSRGEIASGVTRIATTVLTSKMLAGIIRKYHLYPAELEKWHFEDVMQEMKRNILVAPIAGFGSRADHDLVGMQVQFIYTDPVVAQHVTEELVSAFMSESFEDAQARDQQKGVTFRLIDPPAANQDPVSPNWVPLTLIGFFAGALVGLPIAFLRRGPALA